jgi:hypothetical protein
MTRLFTDGAEMQDVSFWSGDTNVVTIGTTTPYGGSAYYSLAVSPTYYPYKNILTISECYFRVRIRSTELIPAYMRICNFRLSTTNVAWLGIDATNHLQASATTIGVLETSSTTITTNTWYLFEIYFKEDDDPNGRFMVYMDGNIVINYTGDTKPSTDTTFDNIMLRHGGVGFSGAMHIDDLALNDTDNSDGKNDNSWCGDGIIGKIYPTGSGATNNWLNSGSTSSSNNYTYVDSFPYSSASYVYASGSSTGAQDQYTMSSLSLSGVTITRIWAESRAKKTQANTNSMKIGFLPSGGTDQLSGSLTMSLDYNRCIGGEVLTNPVTGSGWTTADVNALQYVCEI